MIDKLSLTALAAGLGLLFASAATWAETADTSVEYAVEANLADDSLLLDIERTGDRLVAVGGYGNIVLSDDAGKSWRQAESVESRVTLTSVDFATDQIGIAVGHDAIILKTGDAGETWERIHYDPEEERPLLEVKVLDGGETIHAYGAYGYRLISRDGGESWNSLNMVEEEEDEDGRMPIDYHLHHVREGEDGTWYMAAEAGMAYRSEDRGESWEPIQPPYDGSFFGVLPLKGDSVLMFGLQGNIFLSRDGGENWTEVPNSSSATLNSGVVLEDGTVVLVGNDGAVLTSKTGGQSFRANNLKNRKSIADVIATKAGDILIVGETGVRVLDFDQLAEDF
ncbi:MAG: WD40/YVTN/BNR-like repeat-containing protein [Pseudomonadota bacterium]